MLKVLTVKYIQLIVVQQVKQLNKPLDISDTSRQLIEMILWWPGMTQKTYLDKPIHK